jgi:protease I
MADLSQLRVAVIATNGVEESEIRHPIEALRRENVRVDVISPEGGEIQTMRHDEKSSRLSSDRKLSEARPDEYDALVLPGGALNADKLRMDEQAREFVRRFDRDGKPMAVICHAPWLLVSSGLVRGRTLTSYYTVQDDIRNAGGAWRDAEAVIERNWITSRSPADLEAFNQKLIEALRKVQTPATTR